MIYDITQPLFECEVFPGDPKPEKKALLRMEDGAVCNLTAFSMCAHNGTHVDAPFHFLSEGKAIDQVKLEKFIGPAYVESHEGDVTAQDAKDILERAAKAYDGAQKKILIKGNAVVTLEVAKFFAEVGIDLIINCNLR